MQLTVRDAQRNARDTEILVTLVRSAAEMRNSFEDMKRFIAQQDELLAHESGRQHEATLRTIGGPRPPPPSFRSNRQFNNGGEEELQMQNKRRNVFKRALKGLSMKNNSDLTKIEDMLEHLLGEVECLRGAQGFQSSQPGYSTPSQRAQPDALNQSPGAQAYANGSPRGSIDAYQQRSSPRHSQRSSQNRDLVPPPVPQGRDGQGLDNDQSYFDRSTSSRERLASRYYQQPRDEPSPLIPPPPAQPPISINMASMADPSSAEKQHRKNKSNSSNFFPKISRWSKTTASAFGDNFRASAQSSQVPPQRERGSYDSAPRDSGDPYAYADGAYNDYNTRAGDPLRSRNSLERDFAEQGGGRRPSTQSHSGAPRPPSPLVPSQLAPTPSQMAPTPSQLPPSRLSENNDPKYRAHRDSLNLQHPQPRQGPTDRFQTRLESQAVDFRDLRTPLSPNTTTDPWTSSASLNLQQLGSGIGSGVGSTPRTTTMAPMPTASRQSPLSETGYSDGASAISGASGRRARRSRDDGPLVPPEQSAPQPQYQPQLQQPAPIGSNAGDGYATYADRMVSRSSPGLGSHLRHASYESATGTVPRSPPQRKPSGPRPITRGKAEYTQRAGAGGEYGYGGAGYPAYGGGGYAARY